MCKGPGTGMSLDIEEQRQLAGLKLGAQDWGAEGGACGFVSFSLKQPLFSQKHSERMGTDLNFYKGDVREPEALPSPGPQRDLSPHHVGSLASPRFTLLSQRWPSCAVMQSYALISIPGAHVFLSPKWTADSELPCRGAGKQPP